MSRPERPVVVLALPRTKSRLGGIETVGPLRPDGIDVPVGLGWTACITNSGLHLEASNSALAWFAHPQSGPMLLCAPLGALVGAVTTVGTRGTSDEVIAAAMACQLAVLVGLLPRTVAREARLFAVLQAIEFEADGPASSSRGIPSAMLTSARLAALAYLPRRPGGATYQIRHARFELRPDGSVRHLGLLPRRAHNVGLAVGAVLCLGLGAGLPGPASLSGPPWYWASIALTLGCFVGVGVLGLAQQIAESRFLLAVGRAGAHPHGRPQA